MTERARTPNGNEIQTSHAIQLLEDWAEDGDLSLVGCHPQLAEKITAKVIVQKLFSIVKKKDAQEREWEQGV